MEASCSNHIPITCLVGQPAVDVVGRKKTRSAHRKGQGDGMQCRL